MRNLIKIGILFLFVVGLFIVQPGFSMPVLVDDDVGIDYVQNTDVLTDVSITNEVEIFINPGINDQVAAPLKYLCYCTAEYTNYFIQDVMICSTTTMYDEYTLSWVTLKPKTNPQGKLNISGQITLRKGLYRVAIGEHLQKNLV